MVRLCRGPARRFLRPETQVRILYESPVLIHHGPLCPLFFTMYNIKILNTTETSPIKLFYAQLDVQYNDIGGWISITSGAGQKLTLSHVPVIIFDDSILKSVDVSAFKEIWSEEVNNAYVSGNKILTIFTTTGTPLHLFTGVTITIVEQHQNFTYFKVDDKDIWIYNLGFMVLTK